MRRAEAVFLMASAALCGAVAVTAYWLAIWLAAFLETIGAPL